MLRGDIGWVNRRGSPAGCGLQRALCFAYQVQFFGDEYVLYRQRTWIGIPFLSWRAVLLGIAESRDHLDPLKPQIRRSNRPACVAQFDCGCWVGA